MDVIEGIRVAAAGIASHKLRSLLTMLGIIVGVAAVIAMISLGEGAKRAVEESITALGTNLLYVRPGSVARGGVRYGMGTARTLSEDDARSILRQCPSVLDLAPFMRGNGQVKFGNKNWYTNVVATTPSYQFVSSMPIESGSFFDEAAIKAKARVAVLGKTVVENLFGDVDPVGKIRRINRVAFRVIGVIKERGGTHWYDVDDLVVIPLSTGKFRLFGRDWLSGINVKVVSEDRMKEATVEIEDVLRRRHRLREGQENDFFIRSQADIIEVFGETARTMTFLLSLIHI